MQKLIIISILFILNSCTIEVTCKSCDNAVKCVSCKSVANCENGSGQFSVADFGALGAKGNDDTLGIKLALETALSCKGTLYFPTGEWETKDPLVITGPINIKGEGRGSILVYSGDSSAIKNDVSAMMPDVKDFYQINIYDLHIQGKKGDDAELPPTAIDFTDGTEDSNVFKPSTYNALLSIRRLYIEKFTESLVHIENSYGLHIEGSYLSGGKTGIDLGNHPVIRARIEGNFIRNWSAEGIKSKTDSSNASSGIHISHNIIDWGGYNCTPSASENCSPTGIHAIGIANNITIESNHFEEIANGIGVRLTGINGATIRGNNFSGGGSVDYEPMIHAVKVEAHHSNLLMEMNVVQGFSADKDKYVYWFDTYSYDNTIFVPKTPGLLYIEPPQP